MNQNPLAAAKSMHDLIVQHRQDTESQRRLADPIVEALRAAGLGRMALPVTEGGLGTPPVDALAVFETLAAAEASVAWIVWNSSLPCWFGRFLAPEVRKEVFANPNWLYASSTRPTGRAEAVGDGFRISGRWSLVSGCMHAEWIPVMCLIEEGGEVKMLAPGVPNMRMFFVPRSSHKILDTWYSGGLRGTGSHDTVLENEPVARERSFFVTDPVSLEAPFGRMPIIATISAGCASICLGVAQSTIGALYELASSKPNVDPGPGLRDRPPIQSMLARVSAKLDASRSHLRAAVGELWDKAAAEGTTPEDIAPVWSAAITTALECRSAVTEVYAAAGASSLYADNPIERAHRDIHAVTQHIAVQPFWLEQAGRVQLGLEPKHPLYAV
jgi:alkylation response protein AidB-like acyl-CoA dehydrogenase